MRFEFLCHNDTTIDSYSEGFTHAILATTHMLSIYDLSLGRVEVPMGLIARFYSQDRKLDGKYSIMGKI